MKEYTELNVPSEETTADTTEALAPDGDLKNDGSDTIKNFSSEKLTNDELCLGYKPGNESHEDILLGAGYDWYSFSDPRPNESGYITADRVFINQSTNEIQGINFNKNGSFCCSYTGANYSDIKQQNFEDCKNKNKA